jgi:hypothetical protein
MGFGIEGLGAGRFGLPRRQGEPPELLSQ